MPIQSEDRELLAQGIRTLVIEKNAREESATHWEKAFLREKIRLFSLFIEELLLWNTKTNLIGKAGVRDVIVRHVFDSLSVYYLLKGKDASILDVGAGAGFPSIPLAIVDRALRITAVERREKRAAFLENVSVLLGLDNLCVFQGDVRNTRGTYDIILARGVGDLSSIHKLTRKVVKEHAMIIAFKGKITEIEKEISRLKEKTANAKGLGLSIQQVKVPCLDEEERNIVIIETK